MQVAPTRLHHGAGATPSPLFAASCALDRDLPRCSGPHRFARRAGGFDAPGRDSPAPLGADLIALPAASSRSRGRGFRAAGSPQRPDGPAAVAAESPATRSPTPRVTCSGAAPDGAPAIWLDPYHLQAVAARRLAHSSSRSPAWLVALADVLVASRSVCGRFGVPHDRAGRSPASCAAGGVRADHRGPAVGAGVRPRLPLEVSPLARATPRPFELVDALRGHRGSAGVCATPPRSSTPTSTGALETPRCRPGEARRAPRRPWASPRTTFGPCEYCAPAHRQASAYRLDGLVMLAGRRHLDLGRLAAPRTVRLDRPRRRRRHWQRLGDDGGRCPRPLGPEQALVSSRG